MKKYAILALSLIMIISAACLVISFADGDEIEGGGDLTKLIVSKSTYEYSEPINIKAIGTGDCYVGIYFPEDPYSLRYVYIDTSMDKGVGSGVEFDIKTAGFSGSNSCEYFPVGDYEIIFYADDAASRKIAWVKIKIVPDSDAPIPEKPLNVSYDIEDPKSGMAKGKLSITLKENEIAKNIVPFWADDNGKLEGYTSLAKIKASSTEVEYEFPKGQMIPEGATKLLVYTSNFFDQLSGECFVVDLPEGAAYDVPDTPLVEFQAVSDIHIVDKKTHSHNTHFLQMLNDIVKNSKDSLGFFVAGDMVDSGYSSEYRKMVELYNSVEGAPPYFMAIGNHDLFSGTLQEKTALFLKYAKLPDGTNPKSTHYDFWLDGYHFVFLGCDELVNQIDTKLTNETLEWLDKTLAEDRDKGRPIFLFLHQGMYNTVAGTLPGENWDGVVSASETRLRLVLKKYPEVMMFNGHSHWNLDSTRTMYPKTGPLPNIFNTGAVSYLWSVYNTKDGERAPGSEGYYVKVYEDRVLVLGRNFEQGKWVASAQFVVDFENGTGQRKYTVSFETGNIGEPVADIKVAPGGSVLLPLTSAEGYTFEGWYLDPEFTNPYDSTEQFSVNSDVKLYAKWEKALEPTPEPTVPTTQAPVTMDVEDPSGDDNGAIVWICVAVAVVIIAGVVAVVIVKKKK